jgi:hypothetical protein
VPVNSGRINIQLTRDVPQAESIDANLVDLLTTATMASLLMALFEGRPTVLRAGAAVAVVVRAMAGGLQARW